MRTFPSAVAGLVFLAATAVGTAGHADEAGLYFGADLGLFDFDLPGKASELQACKGDDCGNVGSPSYDDISFRASGVVGMGVTENLRAEGELFFDISTASGSERGGEGASYSVSGDIRTWGLMLNGWFDIGSDTAWGLYAGGGAGLMRAKTSVEGTDGTALRSSGSDSDTETVFQLGGGVHIQGWHVGYRFMRSSDLNDYGNITAHMLMAGFRLW